MKHRKLRTAWSVTWGLVAVLLVALWVRSYWRVDALAVVRGDGISVLSDYRGKLFYSHISDLSKASYTKWSWESKRLTLTTPPPISDGDGPTPTEMGSGWFPLRNGLMIIIPHISLITLAGVIAVLPWIAWSTRFSLRTLLIATTLVAVGLGLIVWASN